MWPPSRMSGSASASLLETYSVFPFLKSLISAPISVKTTDTYRVHFSYQRLLSTLLPSSFSSILNNLVFFPQISQVIGCITQQRPLFSSTSLKCVWFWQIWTYTHADVSAVYLTKINYTSSPSDSFLGYRVLLSSTVFFSERTQTIPELNRSMVNCSGSSASHSIRTCILYSDVQNTILKMESLS